MQATKLLLVEDDRNIARALALALRSTYRVDIAATGEQALSQTDNQEYGLVILDLNLPDISGMIVCQELRERGITAPVLILTGESQVLTKINLLDAGANDYLTKPFSLGELKARLRVLIRNSVQPKPPVRILKANGLSLDRQKRAVTREDVTINLRRKEFALLECLMEHAGSVVTRGTLTRHAWQGAEDPWTNNVDVHIKYLRDKIDRPFEQPILKTVHGLGYRLDSAPSLSGQQCML
jgi:DNA-binding response OmpR family regulator